jgi:hypothetical protein
VGPIEDDDMGIDHALVVYWNGGIGSFGQSMTRIPLAEDAPVANAVGALNLDEDGAPEIVILAKSGPLFFDDLNPVNDPPWKMASIDGVEPGGQAIAVADFDRDGLQDLAIGYRDSVRIYKSLPVNP